MLIRRGDPLSSRRRYYLYRVWVLAWILIFTLFLALWGKIGIGLKIFFFCVLVFTLPDNLTDMWRPYESYKKEWERINRE
jgi:hypothetical protein